MTGGSNTLRVVEVSSTIAPAVCGRLLAALGHHVVQFGPRQCPAFQEGPFTYVALHAGKTTHDLAIDASLADRIIAECASADILLLDLTPAEASALGLEPASLASLYPSLVIVSLTGFGLEGRFANLPADSMLAEAYGGLMSMIGEPGEPPLKLGGNQAEYAAAWIGLYGTMLAILKRKVNGSGDIIEVASADVVAYMDWKSDVAFQTSGTASTRSGSSMGTWRILPAIDGWVGVIYQLDQWQAIVQLLGDERLADPALNSAAERNRRADEVWTVLAEWISTRRAQDIYHQSQALGLPFGYAADLSTLLSDAQFIDRGFVLSAEERRESEPVVRLPFRETPATGTNSWKPASTLGTGPLSGLVVVDFGIITAGAATSRLLADYGATVIKVESVSRPDPFRQWGNDGEGKAPPESPVFASNNAGKIGLNVDMKTPHGRKIVQELCARAHVVVENYRIGVTKRLGIDPESLSKLNSNLIYLSLSSQGQSGPEAGYSSYGSTLDLISGLAAMTGYRQGTPLWTTLAVNYPDQVISLAGAALIAHGLVTGRAGVHIDVSQREVVAWTLAPSLAEVAFDSREPVRDGNRQRGKAPHDTYPCKAEGTRVAIACSTPAHRQALADVITDLANLPSSDAWFDSQTSIDAIIARWSHALTVEQAVDLLLDGGVPAVPVRTAADRATDVELEKRRVILKGESWLKGFPMRLHGYTPAYPTKAPALTQDIQVEEAGSDAMIARIVDRLLDRELADEAVGEGLIEGARPKSDQLPQLDPLLRSLVRN